MAVRHESWIAELFETLEPDEVDALIALLERAKTGMTVDNADEEEPA